MGVKKLYVSSGHNTRISDIPLFVESRVEDVLNLQFFQFIEFNLLRCYCGCYCFCFYCYRYDYISFEWKALHAVHRFNLYEYNQTVRFKWYTLKFHSAVCRLLLFILKELIWYTYRGQHLWHEKCFAHQIFHLIWPVVIFTSN